LRASVAPRRAFATTSCRRRRHPRNCRQRQGRGEATATAQCGATGAPITQTGRHHAIAKSEIERANKKKKTNSTVEFCFVCGRPCALQIKEMSSIDRIMQTTFVGAVIGGSIGGLEEAWRDEPVHVSCCCR